MYNSGYFLYYANKRHCGLWDYCLYASVSCDKNNKGELDEFKKLLEHVIKLKISINEGKYAKEKVRKNLKELIDIGVVKEYNDIIDTLELEAIKEYIGKHSMEETHKNILLSINK